MNSGDQHTTMTDWLGADCPVDYLNVWFPAHWSPIVLREQRSGAINYPTERRPSQSRAALGQWMRKKIFPHSLVNSKLTGLTSPSMTSCSSLPPSKRASFEECSNRRQLAPGSAVVQRRPKLRFFSLGIAASVSGLTWLTVCRAVGPKASIWAGC